MSLAPSGTVGTDSLAEVLLVETEPAAAGLAGTGLTGAKLADSGSVTVTGGGTAYGEEAGAGISGYGLSMRAAGSEGPSTTAETGGPTLS